MNRTIADILADARIRLKSLRPGHTEQVRCPKCDGGKTRENSLTVTIDPDGEGAVWICHRGSCGWQDGERASPTRQTESRRPTQRPAAHSETQTTNRPDWLYEFFAERKIGARVIHELGIYAAERRFPDPVGLSPAIVFPYVYGGEIVNRKYRPVPAKNPQLQERGALPTLWNIDRLGEAPEEIIFVEGEPDLCALFECGVYHVVTLKDGASKEVREEVDLDAKRFAALKTHASILGKAKKIILAGDNDVAGRGLTEELARRLGRHRCWTVDWPTGCKDAGDVLREHGPDAVQDALLAARPWPMAGIHRLTVEDMLALRDSPPPATLSTGTRATDAVLKLPSDGRLLVVTGFPNHGKTTWARFVMMHTILNHKRRWVVFSPESQPIGQFLAQCYEVITGKPFYDVPGVERMTRDETASTADWVNARVTMLASDAEDEWPSVEWILERARQCVLGGGATDLLIDPWNEIEHDRGQMTETDYIGRSLQRLKAFALRHGCNVWIIAHPAKPSQMRPGEPLPAPGPYAISGSSHWANKADVGLTVHSPIDGQSEIQVWKTRDSRWGRRGGVATVGFNPLIGTYHDV